MAILFASCGSNTVPADIIAKEKMETIIWQLMQSDEYVNIVLARDSTKKSSTERMKRYQQVFQLNKTSEAEFKRSYQYYMAHPDITKILFDSITAKATRQRTELFKTPADSVSEKVRLERMQIEKRKADSSAKAMLTNKNLHKPAADSAAIKKSKRIPFSKRKAIIDSTKKRFKKS